MSNLKLAVEYDFVTVECGKCGVQFAMTKHFNDERRSSHEDWYCPNGHCRVYKGPSEAEKLRAKLADTERQLAAERERAAMNYTAREKAEKKVRKLTKRANAGVCAHCNRTFANVARHMATKHCEER